MPNKLLDEREFELVNIVGAKLGANQRDLSRHHESFFRHDQYAFKTFGD